MESLSEIEEILAKLVSFKSVTSNKEENSRLLDWVESEVKKYFHIERFESNGHHSLIATTHKTKTPKIFLYCHVDVVPGSDACFTMRIEGEKLIGRGVMDMKFALASYLRFIEEMGESVKDLDIGLMLVSDEETGGHDGAKELVAKGYVPEVLLMPDGGFDWKIENKAKGMYLFTAHAEGKPAHSSRPWLGVDATDIIMAFINDLKAQFVQEPCGDDDHWHNTMMVQHLESGAPYTSVPDSADAHIGVRFIPSYSQHEMEALVQRVADRHPRITTCTKVLEPAFLANVDHPAVTAWQSIVKEHGHTASFTHAHGASDGRFFSDTTASVIITAPVCGEYHTEEEWIDRTSLAEFYEVMKQWVLETAKVPALEFSPEEVIIGA